MRCIICDNSNWENVDQFRNKKHGMSICLSCGFISYPNKWQEKEKLIEYYRKQYRAAPTVENLYQGQRKLNYHQEFLNEPIIQKWRKENKKDPVIFEVGSAYGIVLAWFKNMKDKDGLLFPNIDLNGSELTLSYKRNAYHEYGLELKDDFDDSKKYDLIISYKVAEHILDIDLELKRYKNSLKEDGKLYISVPTWFNRLHNFGTGGFSIEYYYAHEHVNVWTKKHFEYLLKKSGFKIIKENNSYYDDTYLCEVDTQPEELSMKGLPTVDYIKECLRKIQLADEFAQKKLFFEALQEWPNFPLARRAAYEFHRKDYDTKGIEAVFNEIINPWLAVDPESYDAYIMAADILMRYHKYNEALKYLQEALSRKPKCETTIIGISNCYRQLAKQAQNPKDKSQFLSLSRNMMVFLKENSLSAFGNAVTWIYYDNALIPMPSEEKTCQL